MAKIDFKRDSTQALGFRLKGRADSIQLIWTELGITEFVCADFEPAHSRDTGQPTLGNAKRRSVRSKFIHDLQLLMPNRLLRVTTEEGDEMLFLISSPTRRRRFHTWIFVSRPAALGSTSVIIVLG